MRSTPTDYCYPIKSAYPHPRYERLENGELVYDYVLYKTYHTMAPTAMDMRPVCLPPSSWLGSSYVGSEVRVSGYGNTANDDHADVTACLLKVGVTKVLPASDRRCRILSSRESLQMCAFDEDADACGGDSGGPLTYRNERYYDNFILVGIVSYGSETCRVQQ